jgi:hypothetical protein
MTKAGHIKHSDLCLGLDGTAPGSKVKLRTCGNSMLQVRTGIYAFCFNTGAHKKPAHNFSYVSKDLGSTDKILLPY